MTDTAKELKVITAAKELCRYTMQITERSPKRFRFTFCTKLQNLTLEVIEKIYRANSIYCGTATARRLEQRREYQETALTAAKLTGYIALLASEQGCITARQYEQITLKSSDCQNLLAAWIKSDEKRTAQNKTAAQRNIFQQNQTAQ